MNPHNTILVIEDDPRMLSATARLLEKSGYRVRTASSGDAGIQSAIEHKPDLVLLDMVLPDIDGLEVCKQLKSDPRTSQLFICILSAKRITSTDQSVGLESGADDYIARPIDNRQLLARIRSMFRLINSEKELNRHRQELEKLVEERTVELRESEEKYRSMMEAMDDAVYICSADYRIVYMNPAMEKRVGRNATGEQCHEAIHGLAEHCSWCPHEKVMGGEVIKTELEELESGKFYSISHSPIFHSDNTISKLSIYRDITELKKLETRIQQAQKMESIGNLAGGIAHDFNNLLCPIIGMAELLMEDLPAGSPEYENVQDILKAGKRGSDLVNQILAFSRQSEHQLIPVRVQRILSEVLKLSRATIPTNIEIEQFLQEDCGMVLADATQLHQVAMNIITNAYHAIVPDSGKISVELKELRLEADDLEGLSLAPGRFVHLSIADTGHGIAPDLLERIFDPYFTSKEKGKGTGLGLAVVYGIIKEHRGEIKVSSEQNIGTSFDIYLPLMDLKVVKQKNGDMSLDPSGSEHILLVDDDEPVALIEEKILKRLGYRVSTYLSSPEALEAFNAAPDSFDLVISDMTMPQLTGDQLARKLKAIRPDIPIFICTGFSERLSHEMMDEIGIKGFLMKPVLKSELAQKVRKILDEASSDRQD